MALATGSVTGMAANWRRTLVCHRLWLISVTLVSLVLLSGFPHSFEHTTPLTTTYGGSTHVGQGCSIQHQAGPITTSVTPSRSSQHSQSLSYPIQASGPRPSYT